MTEGIYFDTPVTIKPTTSLYGVRPQAWLTGQAESLHSYVLTLANRHSWSANRLVREVLPALAAEQDVGWNSSWGWDKNAGAGLVGVGEHAQRLAELLGRLTGREEVRWSTLAPLAKHFCGQGLISPFERVCMMCLRHDLDAGAEPYGRLLWRLEAVTCCPIHQVRLVNAQCGRTSSRRLIEQTQRRRLGGTCGQCGALGFRCIPWTPERATENELWRARQCAELIEQMGRIEQTDPRLVKDMIRAHCGRTNGACALAERIGIPKSLVSNWLNRPTHRFSLAILVDLAASEGFSLARLLQGDLTRMPWSSEIAPMRCRRQIKRHDHERIDQALRQALEGQGTIRSVAAELQVDPSTLARHEDLYGRLRDRRAGQSRQRLERTHQDAVGEAERVYRQLAQRRRRATLRGAGEVTGDAWFSSQLRAVALMEIRRQLGDHRVRAPLKSHNVGHDFRACVQDACRRLQETPANGQLTLFS